MTLDELKIVTAMEEQELLDLLNEILGSLSLHDQTIDNRITTSNEQLVDAFEYGMGLAEEQRESIHESLSSQLYWSWWDLDGDLLETRNALQEGILKNRNHAIQLHNLVVNEIVDASNFLSYAMAEYLTDTKQDIRKAIDRSELKVKYSVSAMGEAVQNTFDSGLAFIEGKISDLYGNFGALWSGFIDNANAVLLWLLELRPFLGSLQWGTMEDFYKSYLEALRTLPTKLEG